jgi:hypothetical protein
MYNKEAPVDSDSLLYSIIFIIKYGELTVDQNPSNPAMEYQDMDDAAI